MSPGYNSSARMTLAIASLVALSITGFVPAFAQPVSIPPGHSFFAVDPGLTWLDFSQNPIPADFFGPGSEPFTGFVPLVGEPLVDVPACPGADLTGVQGIAERQGLIDLPIPGSSSTIAVEMIALELRSAAPITVNFGPGKRAQSYDLHVRPAPPAPTEDWGLWEFTRGLDDAIAVQSNGDNRYSVYSAPVETPELEQIMIEIAASIPVVTVQKQVPRAKQLCTNDYCMNRTEALLFEGEGLQIGLLGACQGPPVADAMLSWGAVKSAY